MCLAGERYQKFTHRHPDTHMCNAKVKESKLREIMAYILWNQILHTGKHMWAPGHAKCQGHVIHNHVQTAFIRANQAQKHQRNKNDLLIKSKTCCLFHFSNCHLVMAGPWLL